MNNNETENIVEFIVDLGDLRHYNNEVRNKFIMTLIKIFKTDSKNYPILIFELLEGFYITKENFKDTFLRQVSIRLF